MKRSRSGAPARPLPRSAILLPFLLALPVLAAGAALVILYGQQITDVIRALVKVAVLP